LGISLSLFLFFIIPKSSLTEIEEVKQFPKYDEFKSKISKKRNNDVYVKELAEILSVTNEKFTKNGNEYTLGDLLEFMSIPDDRFHPFDLVSTELPTEDNDTKYLESLLHTSPIKYVDSKIAYVTKFIAGEYTNLLDYFKVYNQLDVDILMDAWTNLAELFFDMFKQNILMSWSLPGLAQKILLSLYDDEAPPVYTFSNELGFLNKEVRRNICGGFSGPITLR